jgi:hypothetical protein
MAIAINPTQAATKSRTQIASLISARGIGANAPGPCEGPGAGHIGFEPPNPAAGSGRLFDSFGNRMSPSHTNKSGAFSTRELVGSK